MRHVISYSNHICTWQNERLAYTKRMVSKKNPIVDPSKTLYCRTIHFWKYKLIIWRWRVRGFGAQNCNFNRANLHMSFRIANHICKCMYFQTLSDSSHQTTRNAWFRSAKPPDQLQKTLYCLTINCWNLRMFKNVGRVLSEIVGLLSRSGHFR
jgi:hypothetical protein